MSNVELIRARAAEYVRTAIGADGGKVHEFQRFAPQLEKFIELYTDEAAVVKAWTVSYSQDLRRKTGLGTRRHTYLFHIRGYWAVNDTEESEIAFHKKVDAVLDYLSARPTLDNVVTNGELLVDSYPSLVTSHFLKKGKVLLHFGEIQFWFWEEVQIVT